MNVPPPREIPKQRDQLARYSAKQRDQLLERKRRTVARMRAIEEQVKQRELLRARRALDTVSNTRQVIWVRPAYVRGEDTTVTVTTNKVSTRG